MMPRPHTDADCIRRLGLIDLSARVFERTKEFVFMSRGPYPFKQSDITRALKAARKAGVDVKIEVVNTDGRVPAHHSHKIGRRSIRYRGLESVTMKPPRSALHRPRYVERKPLKGGWGYFFNVPTWARKAGCPIRNEALGLDYDAAVARAETVLLPAFDDWRSGGDAPTSGVAAPGTLDWVFAEYRADRRFTKLDKRTKRNHEVGFGLVGGYVLKDGRRLGQARLALITTAITDMIYEKLLVVPRQMPAAT